MIYICSRCNREKKITMPKLGLCDSCRVSIGQHERIIKGKFSEKTRIKNKVYFRGWYQKNKERHKENVKKYYNKIKYKNKIRTWTRWWRENILNIFDNKCIDCGSTQNLEIDHLKYEKFEFGVDNIRDYVRVLCRDCHRKKHRLSERYCL